MKSDTELTTMDVSEYDTADQFGEGEIRTDQAIRYSILPGYVRQPATMSRQLLAQSIMVTLQPAQRPTVEMALWQQKASAGRAVALAWWPSR